MNENVKLKEGFSQVCVWEATKLGDSTPEEFEKHFKRNGFEVQFLEEFSTKPDVDANNEPVPDTGGRSDLFFAIHDRDCASFAIPRISYGIRWVEDCIANESDDTPNYSVYPERVNKYLTWQ